MYLASSATDLNCILGRLFLIIDQPVRRGGSSQLKMKKALFYLGLILLIFFIPQNTLAASKMPEGTTIATVQVANKTEQEVRKQLEDEIIIWKAQDDIVLEGEFETFTVSREAFQFDVDATVKQLNDRTKRSFSNFFKRPKNVHIPFEVSVDESHPDINSITSKSYIDGAHIIHNLQDLAANLTSHTITIPYVEGKEIPLDTLVELKWDIPELSQATLTYLVDELDGKIVPANELFSLLQSVETPERLINSRDETSFLGSALYTLFLQANVDIVERHAQLMIPSYGEAGVHAEVNKRENKDLVVLNKNDVAYRIKMKMENNTLEASLEGIESLENYEISVENKEEVKYRTLYRYSKKLNPGEQQVVQAGENGLKVEVYREIYENGVYVGQKLISKDLYLPKPRIFLVSTDDIESIDEEDIIIGDDDGLLPPLEPGGGGPSISDLLPDRTEDEPEYEAIKEIEKLQKEYRELLDLLFEEQSDEIEQIKQFAQNLNLILGGLIHNLYKKDAIDDEFIFTLIDEELISEELLEKLIEDGFDPNNREDGVDNGS